MEKVSDNLLLFSRNLQANGAQFFWDTLYIYSLAQSQYVIEIDIDTQKEHIRLNVSAKAFISNNCSKSDGAYIKISKLQRTQNNSLSRSYLLQSVIMMC